jgi:hypothetical protein
LDKFGQVFRAAGENVRSLTDAFIAPAS